MNKRESGNIIIVVLVILLLISIIAASSLNRGFFDLQKTKNLFKSNLYEITAYSAIEHGKTDISDRLNKKTTENFTFLLNGSESDLNIATIDNPVELIKNGNINNLSYKVFITNNTEELKKDLFSEDQDNIIMLKALVSNEKRLLYTLYSYFFLDKNEQKVKIIATHRAVSL
ncbi:MAG: hypothetical protein GY760_08155 [Deltaproteobacteria bacterium]|nr:hypothetical protein [Deltaproteobacteria bacterium]